MAIGFGCVGWAGLCWLGGERRVLRGAVCTKSHRVGGSGLGGRIRVLFKNLWSEMVGL